MIFFPEEHPLEYRSVCATLSKPRFAYYSLTIVIFLNMWIVGTRQGRKLAAFQIKLRSKLPLRRAASMCFTIVYVRARTWFEHDLVHWGNPEQRQQEVGWVKVECTYPLF